MSMKQALIIETCIPTATARLETASMGLNQENAPNESVGLRPYERTASLRQ